MKKIAILGSTGSIGTQTLDIVRANGDIRVEAIAARANIDLLEKQIREFSPKLAGVWDEKKAAELKLRVADGAEGRGPGHRHRRHDRHRAHHRGHPGRQGYCPGQQGDAGLRGTHHHAAGGGPRYPYPSGGFGALGHFPESPGKQEEPDREDPADCLRRSLPEILREEAEDGDAGGRPQASQLEHGAEGHHRLLDHGEQGA